MAPLHASLQSGPSGGPIDCREDLGGSVAPGGLPKWFLVKGWSCSRCSRRYSRRQRLGEAAGLPTSRRDDAGSSTSSSRINPGEGALAPSGSFSPEADSDYKPHFMSPIACPRGRRPRFPSLQQQIAPGCGGAGICTELTGQTSFR